MIFNRQVEPRVRIRKVIDNRIETFSVRPRLPRRRKMEPMLGHAVVLQGTPLRYADRLERRWRVIQILECGHAVPVYSVGYDGVLASKRRCERCGLDS